MRFPRKNRWDVQVCFKGWMATGLTSRHDLAHTPEDVIAALTEFVAKVKKLNRRYQRRLAQIRRDPALRARAIEAGILKGARRG